MNLRPNSLLTDERTRWWREARLGMFIHWGLYSIPARGEWVMYNERVPIKEYGRLQQEFNPATGSPHSWARLARSAGMKYLVLTTKHHDGFCLFDSKLTDYTSLNTPARRDLVGEYVEACRAEGLRVGFYYSVMDWRHPNYPWHRHPTYIPIDRTYIQPDEKAYYQYMMGQLRELLTNYGQIDVLWFDITYQNLDAGPMAKMIRTLQPGIMINNRADSNQEDGNDHHRRLGVMGDFVTPEQFVPKGRMTIDDRPVLWETCNTLAGDAWGYNKYGKNFRAPEEYIKMIALSASGGGNMLLNVGPRPDGRIQSEAVSILKEIGKWMRKYGESIYATSAGPAIPLSYGVMTVKGRRLYVHVFDWPANGRLPLPSLKGKPISASVLGGEKLSWSGNHVRVPRVAPNHGNSVLAFDYESPEAMQPAVTTAPAVVRPAKEIRQSKKRPGHRPIDYVVKPGQPIVVNGEIRPADWKYAKPVRVTNRDHWDEPVGRRASSKRGECAFTFRMMHAEATLYIAVEIESSAPIIRSRPWSSCDSAEIVMGANPLETELRYNRESFQILIDADGKVLIPHEARIPGLVFRHAACRTKKGFNIVWALPLGVLLKDAGRPDSDVRIGDTIDFNIVVNQADTACSYWSEYQRPLQKGQPWWAIKPPPPPGLRHRVFWKGGGRENRPLTNRCQWGRVKLSR